MPPPKQPEPVVAAVDTLDVAPPLMISSDARLSSLLKEAKAYRQKFRTIIEHSDVRPGTANVEFARKELRNAYLKLLFHFTFAGRTRGTEHSIWFETTHPLVHLYRSQLSAIEAKLRRRDEREAGGDGRTKQKGAGTAPQPQNHLAQNHVKLASAFRVFLASEELFWRDLAGRIVLLYNAVEILPHLRALDIVGESGLLAHANASGVERVVGLEVPTAESQAEAALPSSLDRLTEIVHKALLYCGDLARYSEQYRDDEHEADAHAASHAEKRTAARGRGRGRGGMRGGHSIVIKDTSTATRDFSRAAAFYEQARHLLPSNGNPWNQLAVLAAYRGDQFTFVYDCYRALCVSEPFDKAKHNMERTVRKTLDKWLEQGGLTRYSDDADDEARVPHLTAAATLHDLAVLHAAYFLHDQNVLFSQFPTFCLDSVRALLRRKALPTGEVVRIVMTAIAALWLHRLWRGTSAANKLSGAASSIVVEHSILLHLCGITQAMLDIGANEVVETMASDEPDVSTASSARSDKTISPALRRMLPALRLLSKWVKAHVGYVQKSRHTVTPQTHSLSSSDDPESNTSVSSARAYEKMAIGVDRMWKSYANFVNVIRYAFPFESLPSLGTSMGQSGMTGIDFEEDRDIRGFIPMKKSTMVEIRNGDVTHPTSVIRPEEEHLIRIADIMIDAKVVAETQSSPIQFIDEKNSFEFVTTSESLSTTTGLTGSVPLGSKKPASRDDDLHDASESSEDAVDLAMRAVDERRRALAEGQENGKGGDESGEQGALAHNGDGGDEDDDDDDDEIILIPASRGRSSIGTPSQHSTVRKLLLDDAPPSTHHEPLSAQHLLLQVINGSPRAANSATSSPKPALGPIGSPIARNTPSPQGYNPPSAAWPNDVAQPAQHRADIWAPPTVSTEAPGHLHQNPFGSLPGWIPPTQPSNLRDWPGNRSRDGGW